MDSASPNSLLAEEARGAPSYGSCWGAQFQVSCGAECTPNFIPGKRHSMVRRATRIEPAAVHHPRLEAPSHTCARRRPSLQYAELRPPWPRSPEQGRRSTFVWLSSRLLNANTPPANHPGDTSRASSATAAAIASWCRSPGSAPSAPSSPRASSTSAPRASGTVHPRTWVAAAWSD